MTDIIKQAFKAINVTAIDMSQKLKTGNEAIDYITKLKNPKYKNVGFIVAFEHIPSEHVKYSLLMTLDLPSEMNGAVNNLILINYNYNSRVVNKDNINTKSVNKCIESCFADTFDCVICFERVRRASACSVCNNMMCVSCYDKMEYTYRQKLLHSNDTSINVLCPICRNVLITLEDVE